MVACDKLKNLKDLAIPTRMKDYNEVDLKASVCAEKQVGRVMGAATKDRAHEIVFDGKASTDMRERLYENINLVEQGTHHNSCKKKFVINARRSNDEGNRLQEQKRKNSTMSCSFKGKRP